MGRLLLAFTLIPLLEVFLLVRIGQQVGFLPTVAGVLVVGFIGAWLARREGRKVLREWRETMARGQLPSEGLTGGLLVLVGGVMLISPGVLTDVGGLFLLFPPTRALATRFVRRWLDRQLQAGTLRVSGLSSFGGFGRPPEREVRGEATVRPATRDDEPRLPR